MSCQRPRTHAANLSGMLAALLDCSGCSFGISFLVGLDVDSENSSSAELAFGALHVLGDDGFGG